MQRCDECIEQLEELCRTKRAVINYNHIEPRRFLEDAGNVVLERVRDAVERHGSVKVNAAFNGEFATKDKRAIKSINTKNIEIYRCTDIHACTTSVRAKNWSYTQWTAEWCAFYRRRSPTRKMRRTHISGTRYAVWATTCVAHTTTRCHRITSVATKTVYHGSRDNSTIWRIAASLDKLASYLDEDKLKIVHSEFSTLSDEKLELLTRKGVFPYEYVDCVEKLQDTRLPPRESFYSSLTGDTVSESDYAHAVNIWQRFSIRTIGEYSDLYLKTEFELLTDIDMVMFIERGIRGGPSQCSGRYAQANNKYMRSYDPSESSTYLMYYDVNNLYGWAMCQPLPYAEFQWVKDVANFDVSAIAPDSPIDYILEVDLEYPQDLHDVHADLPFCPTRDKPPGKREDKLLATVYDKKRYVIHYRNLQQCTRHGLRVTKIHRVLQFAQSPWLRDYIELNTNFRTHAKNDFEKNLYKLMNNAVFGKTMENVRNHVDVKLLTKWDRRYGAEAMIAKPNYSHSIFAENLIAVELRKLEVKFNKPIYVGMCILDISEVCLYEFHYDYMLPLFHDKCKIMYTDTDSLIYRVECENIYETIKRDIARFDTSDYLADNAYGMSLANKKVPGIMKDENNGMIMTEFVGLRAKMYALKVDGKKDTKKAKGERKNNVVARMITFDDYTQCLNEEIEMTGRQSCIRSKLHEVYTISESKIALSPYDDKRYVVPDSTETLPWGHWRIPL
ncbi:hypothetical protein ALC57_04403 [Trachymyrmex cornetzi]|uniref:DNA-directed DNA polymerase n=1 Tax=Trachymyrmex cornetzi TaxID=471704 RepID=A0A151JCR7_9HYME|nr:hypothetical protein ALC57_04403 [Trachymyrmex cornetzi]